MRSLLATLSLLLLLAEGKARTRSRNVVRHRPFSTERIIRSPFVAVRGGATIAADGDSDVEDEYDDYEDEDEDESKMDPKLTKSAISSTTKVQAKKTSAAKEAVSAKLKNPKKQSGGLLKALKVPYFVRACMNPFTVVAMTKAYFASLFNLDYLKEEDSSQSLRSAMEEKAKKTGGAGGRKGKRQMKPGQAKTLSDLPQLSA